MTVTLREDGWSAENRVRIERAIGALAARQDRRVAVLDWDNTMMRGDIGDLVLAELVHQGAPLQPPPSDDPMLTPQAHAALARAGDRTALERVVAHLSWRGRTPDGEPGFTVPISRFHHASYAFMAQVIATGRTDEEQRALARRAFARASEAALGATTEIHGIEVDGFARLHRPMVELAHALEAVGVEVWIVSASPQAVVEALAELAGLSPARVIGVRSVRDREGRGTARFQPCGEGAVDTPVITWLEGKRAWINKLVFGVPPARQRDRQDDPALRPVLAAGDSDGDLAMLQDATELSLVLDRHQLRVMCNALASPERWIVQPLFVAPLPPRTEPYPCATATDALGPVRDEHGRPIPDQPVR